VTISDQANETGPTEVGVNPNKYPGPVKRGDRGEAVKVWQTWLKKRVNKQLKVDGVYGDSTFHAATFWQKHRPASRNVDGVMAEYMYHSLVNDMTQMQYDASEDTESFSADEA
jgi:peptidoglycan hydrolase-like protein with peptidoglycan-binding domain